MLLNVDRSYQYHICFILLFTFVFSPFASYGEIPNTPKTIKRKIDPIVITLKEIPSIKGTAITSFRLVSYKQKEIKPIPFQIDEKNETNEYIFRTSHPDIQDIDQGKIDENDELAFMAEDLGDRISEPDMANLNLQAEIEVTDPADMTKGWCYVAGKTDFPDFSPKDYVAYDPATDGISAQNYTVTFSKEAPISYGHTTITPQGGGNNKALDERIITRLDASFLRLLKISRNEEDFKSQTKGYIDGPVRVIKQVGNSLRQVFGIYGPEVVVNYIFYNSSWTMPSIIDLPVDVKNFVSNLNLRGGTHWSQNAAGMVFYTKYIPPGTAVIDGHMSDAEKKLDLRLDPENIWHVYTGALNNTGQGSLLFRILMDDTLTKTVHPKTNFYDNYNDNDFQEDRVSKNEYTRFFEGSYTWYGLEDLPKGRYYLTSWAMVMPDYAKVGDEKKYLSIHDKPVDIAVALNKNN